MASYPTTLPQPTASGYSVKPVDQTLRTDLEKGAARVRRITAARLDKISFTLIFSTNQLQTFRSWFDSANGAAGGAAWFSMSLSLGNGAGLTTETVRFVNPPSFSKAGGGLVWTAAVEVEAR
jgi:hypothetical protein